MSITDFLEARIFEDEVAAWVRIDAEVENLRSDGIPNITRADLLHMDESDSWRRPIAECAAKRVIVEQTVEASSDRSALVEDGCLGEPARSEAYASDPGLLIMRALAAIYKDHPDYRQEWGL